MIIYRMFSMQSDCRHKNEVIEKMDEPKENGKVLKTYEQLVVEGKRLK